MWHKKLTQVLGVILVVGLSSFPFPPETTDAQSSSPINGLTHYALTVYSQPDRDEAITGVLVPRAKVVLEARSADTNWVLGHSTDGATRGWMERRFLEISPGSEVVALPVSREVMFILERVYSVDNYTDINLLDYPVIPDTLGQARDVFARGQTLAIQRNHISRVGDCISDNQYFLSPFGWGQYNLGGYTHLQAVIDYFDDALATDSLAAYDGLVTSAVLDPLFANPLVCEAGESPLRCEYRVHQPGVAIIMFGAQDLLFTTAEDFDRNLRQIVHETLQAGVIPVLSTFPGNLSDWERDIFYNQIVVQIALDYDVPLMNLWRALEALPNHGLDGDGRHLSPPLTTAGDLTGENLQRGYPLRNLVTLQVLDAVWRGAMY